MFRRIDRSPGLAKFIASLSEFIAKRRGLPVIVGIALIVVSFAIQLLEIYMESRGLRLFGVLIQHIGILTSLIGLLVAEALGR